MKSNELECKICKCLGIERFNEICFELCPSILNATFESLYTQFGLESVKRKEKRTSFFSSIMEDIVELQQDASVFKVVKSRNFNFLAKRGSCRFLK